MPAKFKTEFKGVSYRYNKSAPTDRVYYVQFRRKEDQKLIEQKVGAESEGMTPERAHFFRDELVKGTMELARDLKRKQKRAVVIKRRRWTIERIVKKYLEEKTLLGSDKSSLLNYIVPVFGNYEVEDITITMVNDFRLNLLNGKISKKGIKFQKSSVKQKLKLFERIINYGFRNRWCPKLDFEIEKPKVGIKNRDFEFLSKSQLKRFLEEIDKCENKSVSGSLKLALYTGMRRGELLKLEWSDIDFEKNWISIRFPKSGVDEKIPLNHMAKELLLNHPKTKKCEIVFPGPGNKKFPRTPKEASLIRDAAGLPSRFRPYHGLRHNFASMLASSGKVSLFELQKLLTHKNIAETMRYSHLMDKSLTEASNVIGAIINGGLK